MNPPPRDPEDYLDRFLTSAFDAMDEGGAAPLPAIAAAESELETDDVPDRLGRYPVAERIGLGGIGVVYRVNDPDLGRDLAIKVIRTAYADNEEMVARFMEEARICSRLQHPGVVPVHELGRLEDGRPYFTMKIVDGQTLSRLLRERNGLERDDSRLLEIFERICETLAFAHSHGVTHSDLTPQNVMVGAFGEVQVMDWGFARTSGATAASSEEESEPQLTRVIGTPAYLAPEQARGERGKVGPATDVFGLGAILCEILTGAPPYLGDTKTDVLLRAAKGWQDDARARLEACAVDPTLLDLCRRCLQPDMDRRPTDAGVVAREMREYLSTLEARARALELEAAEARAVAVQERRSRRLAIALGVVALLAVIVPGAIHLRNVKDQADRRAETERAVVRSLERARSQFDIACREHASDPDAFAAALQSAHEAEILAGTPAADPASLPRARALAAEVAREQQRAETDRAMAAHLNRLRLLLGDDRSAVSDGSTWSLTTADAGARWTELSPAAAPSQRMDHDMVACGDTILLFGGAVTRSGPLLRDTWSWDGDTWTELVPATVPAVRSGHAMSYDPVRNCVVMFSGAASPAGSVLYHADTWEWDRGDWRLMAPVTSPPRRDWAGLCYDPNSGTTILFGGRDSNHAPSGSYEPYGDTWSWDGSDWTRLFPETSPPPRHGHRMAYDPNTRKVILAGGQYPKRPGYDDTWAWDGSNWSRLAPASSYDGRAFIALAFDAAASRLVLHGGKDVVNDVLLADTWEFDGATWVRVADDGPAYGWFPAAHDAARGATLLQGGSISSNRFENLDARFAAAFREYGIDIEHMDATAAAAGVDTSAIRQDLICALDAWALALREQNPQADGTWKKLIRVTDLADADAWRRKVREAFSDHDLDRLRELAAAAENGDQPATSYDLLAGCLTILGDREAAIRVLRPANLRHPGDFNIHYRLADLLETVDPAATEEILRLLHMAVAIRPDSSRALADLAGRLASRNEYEKAVSILERAVRIDPEYGGAWYMLGTCRQALGRYPEAREALDEAVLRGEWAAETELASVLHHLGLLEDAVAAARYAIAMSPGNAVPHAALAAIRLDRGEPDQALGALGESLQLDPQLAAGHYLLGQALLRAGRFAEAATSLRRGLELGGDDSGEWAARCRSWIERAEGLCEQEPRLPGLLAGDPVPADPTNRMLLAEAVHLKGDHLPAAKLFLSAFFERPVLARGRLAVPCWSAVQAAALAAAGEEAGALDETERARWRRVTLRWLMEDLAVLRDAADPDRPALEDRIGILVRWLNDPAFTLLRGERSDLPEEERADWREFWRSAETLLAESTSQ